MPCLKYVSKDKGVHTVDCTSTINIIIVYPQVNNQHGLRNIFIQNFNEYISSLEYSRPSYINHTLRHKEHAFVILDWVQFLPTLHKSHWPLMITECFCYYSKRYCQVLEQMTNSWFPLFVTAIKCQWWISNLKKNYTFQAAGTGLPTFVKSWMGFLIF